MSQKTVLSVDDSASIRQVARLTLEWAGYRVLEAASGEEALLLCEREGVDAFITDLNMPGMDGIELIRRLRLLPQHRFTPILIVTTESQQERKLEGKAAGATGWVVKPFTPEQLSAVVRRVCPA